MTEFTEMPGKKPNIVQSGPDPNDVSESFQESAGSVDTVFQKIEQFANLEKMADTIEDAIKHARDMAERAKIKVEEESEVSKARAIEDGKEITAMIINEAGKRVLAHFDNASAILARTMDEIFKKAREQVSSDRTKTREQIEKHVWAEIDRIVKGVEHRSQELSKSEHRSTITKLDNETASTISPTPSDPWQDAR